MSTQVCAVVGVGAGLGLSSTARFGREGYRIAMIARRNPSFITLSRRKLESYLIVYKYSR